MAGTYLIQVSDQTGVPAAVSYGCKKYRVSKDTRVDKLVDTVVKDHGLPDDSDYMKDKMMCVKLALVTRKMKHSYFGKVKQQKECH
jgi:hypothetical protein